MINHFLKNIVMNIKEITKQISLSTYIYYTKKNNVCPKISSNTLLVPSKLHFSSSCNLGIFMLCPYSRNKDNTLLSKFHRYFFLQTSALNFQLYFAYFIPAASPTLPGKTNNENHKQIHTIRYAMQHNNMTGMYQAPML